MVADVVHGAEKIALTPGEQKRDFIFIDDAADAMMTIMDASSAMANGFHYFEVGSGTKLSIREFMSLLVRLADNKNTHLDFGAIPYRENEAMETHVDLSGLRALGWSSRIPLEEGLKRTIAAERARTILR
jgi:nucleoside-diphosphate-sugar epimerase